MKNFKNLRSFFLILLVFTFIIGCNKDNPEKHNFANYEKDAELVYSRVTQLVNSLKKKRNFITDIKSPFEGRVLFAKEYDNLSGDEFSNANLLMEKNISNIDSETLINIRKMIQEAKHDLMIAVENDFNTHDLSFTSLQKYRNFVFESDKINYDVKHIAIVYSFVFQKMIQNNLFNDIKDILNSDERSIKCLLWYAALVIATAVYAVLSVGCFIAAIAAGGSGFELCIPLGAVGFTWLLDLWKDYYKECVRPSSGNVTGDTCAEFARQWNETNPECLVYEEEYLTCTYYNRGQCISQVFTYNTSRCCCIECPI